MIHNPSTKEITGRGLEVKVSLSYTVKSNLKKKSSNQKKKNTVDMNSIILCLPKVISIRLPSTGTTAPVDIILVPKFGDSEYVH